MPALTTLGKSGQMTRSPRKLSVLYADYSERNIAAVKAALEPLELAAFHSSDNRNSVVEMTCEYRPDVILIGLNLDGLRGISTIRELRNSASDDDPFCNQVPVLLGAPKLDRRAMREAVEAGIEGVFRQPIDSNRLRKIVQTVIKTPRRFVFEGDYFGPARDGDKNSEPSRKIRPKANAPKQNIPPAEPDKPSDGLMADTPETSPDDKDSTVVRAPRPSRSVTMRTTIAGKSNAAASLPRMPARKPIAKKEPSNFDPEDLLPEPSKAVEDKSALETKSVLETNIDAAVSAREALETEPEPATVEPPSPDEVPNPTDTSVDEELVEIDLMEALLAHRLWVDSGGKEGAKMAIEHADLRDADLEGIDLTRCSLPHVSFRNANCKNAVLRRCNMTAADFIGSNLDQANLAVSRLAGARFTDAILRGTVFLGSDLSGASFQGMTLLNCDLSGSNLTKTDFRDADLSGVRGLFAEQIQRARVNANTRLPRDMKLKG